MKLKIKLVCWLSLASGVALYAQAQEGGLTPSNLDQAPQSQPAEPNEPGTQPPVVEPESSIRDQVNLADPKFYAKLAVLIGSILLARKAFRQMQSS